MSTRNRLANRYESFSGPFDEEMGLNDLAPLEMATQVRVPDWQPLADELISQWQRFGIDPTISGVNRAEELARLLTNYGISDLSKLGLKQTPYTQTYTYGGGGGEGDGQAIEQQVEALGKQLTYGDKAFGYLGGFGSKGQEEFGQEDLLRENNDLVGWSAAGKGNVSYRAVQGSDGQVYIVPQWGSSSDWKDFRDMVRTGAAFASAFLPGAGAAIGASLGLSGTAATAVGNAILGGVASGDAQGAVLGGLGGVMAGSQAVTSTASQIGQAVADMTGSAAVGSAAAKAVTSMAAGLPQAVASGDFESLLKSGLASVVPAGLSEVTGLSPQQIQGGIAVARGIESGNLSQILSGAGTFLDSPDVRLAGAAARVIEAADSGNISAILSSVQGLNGAISQVQNARAIEQAYGEQGQASRVAEGQAAVDRASEYLSNIPPSSQGSAADALAGVSGAAAAPALSAAPTPSAAPAPSTAAAAPAAGAFIEAGSSVAGSPAAAPAVSTTGLPAFNNAAIRTLEQSRAAEIIAEMHSGRSLDWVTQAQLNAAASHIRNNDEAGLRERLRSGSILGTGEPQYGLSGFDVEPGYRLAQPGEIGSLVGYGPRGEAGRLIQQIDVTGKRLTDAEANRVAEELRGTELFGSSTPEEQQDIAGAEGTRVSTTPLDNSVVGAVRGVTSAAASGIGEQAQNIGTALSWMTGNPDNALSRWGADVQSWASAITPSSIKEGQENIFKTINDAQGLSKIPAAIVSVVENPLAFAHMLGKEGIQEVLPLGTAVSAGKAVSAAAKAAYGQAVAARLGLGTAIGVNATMDAGESASASYKEVYDDLRSRGVSEDAASSAASRAAGMAGALTLFTSAVGDSVLIERMMGQVKDVAIKASLKDLPTEFVQGYGQSVAEQQAKRGDLLFDPNAAATSGVVEAAVGSGTTAGIAKGADFLGSGATAQDVQAPGTTAAAPAVAAPSVAAAAPSVAAAAPGAIDAAPAFTGAGAPERFDAADIEELLSLGVDPDQIKSIANNLANIGMEIDLGALQWMATGVLPDPTGAPPTTAPSPVDTTFGIDFPVTQAPVAQAPAVQAPIAGPVPAPPALTPAPPAPIAAPPAPTAAPPAPIAAPAAPTPAPAAPTPAPSVVSVASPAAPSPAPVASAPPAPVASPAATPAPADAGLVASAVSAPPAAEVSPVTASRTGDATTATTPTATTGAATTPTGGETAMAGLSQDDVLDIVNSVFASNPGLSIDQVKSVVESTIAANPGLTMADVNSAVTGALSGLPASVTPDQMQSAISGAVSGLGSTVTGQIGDLRSDITAALDAAKAQGLQGDAVLQAGLDKVAADLGVTRTDLLAQMGTTEQALRGEFSSQIGGVQTQVGQLGDSLRDAIAEARNAGLEGDAALQAGIDRVAGDLGTTRQDLLSQIGQTEQSLRGQFETALGGVKTEVQQSTSRLDQRIDELVQQGLDQNTATQRALDEISGQVTTSQTQTQTALSDVNARIDELMRQGVDYQTATQTAISELGGGLGELGRGFQEYIAGQERQREQDRAAQQQAQQQAQQRAQSQGMMQQALTTLGVAGAAAGPVQDYYAKFKDPFVTRMTEQKFTSPLESFLQEVRSPSGFDGTFGSDTTRQPDRIKQEQSPMDYFNYGKVQSVDDLLKLGNEEPTLSFRDGGVVPAYYGGGEIGYAGGGALNVVNFAGKPRIDFRHGSAVHGPGDGQSDDIPAMLADGEYVFDAETVSALGNGSTKAGAEALDKMRIAIRKHKRSGSLDSIPPESKSPLEYLAMGNKRGKK